MEEKSAAGFRIPKCLTFGYGEKENYLYWISKGYEKIQFCKIQPRDKVCFQVETVRAADVTAPLAIAYYDNSLLVAVGRFQPEIGILKLSDLSYRSIRPNTNLVVSLKMFSPEVQTGSNACTDNNGNCSQLCLPVSKSSRSCNCTAGYIQGPLDNTACLPMNSTLLYSMGSQIHGVSLDPSQKDELLPPVSRISQATALDFEAVSSYIYWVDPKLTTLNRMRRDLTGKLQD